MAQVVLPHDHLSKMVTNLRAGDMRVYLPGALTPEAADPVIGGRSIDGLWKCLAHLATTKDNQFVIARVDVMPWTGEAMPLGTTALRQLPLSLWLAKAHSVLVNRTAEHLTSQEPRPHRRQHRRLMTSKTPGPGRRGYGNAFYRQVAHDYLQIQGHLRPDERMYDLIGVKLFDRFGLQLDYTQVRDAVNMATSKGYLTKGTRGKIGRLQGPNLFSDDKGDS